MSAKKPTDPSFLKRPSSPSRSASASAVRRAPITALPPVPATPATPAAAPKPARGVRITPLPRQPSPAAARAASPAASRPAKVSITPLPGQAAKPDATPARRSHPRPPRHVAQASAPASSSSNDEDDDATLKTPADAAAEATLREENLYFAGERAYLAGNYALQQELGDRTKKLNRDVMTIVEQRQKEQMGSLADVFRQSQLVSLCFLLDTTGSMGSHIAGVKEMILRLVDSVAAAGCQLKYVAFVGYKDWQEGDMRTTPGAHFEQLPFTNDIARFRAFVAGINAAGGDDGPEDVLGGLRVVSGMSWPQGSGCHLLFHIADAPPHGTMYHEPGLRDNFPTGHPADPKLADVV